MRNTLVNCDLINGGREKYTLICDSEYSEEYKLVCLVDPTECQDVTFVGSSLRGYIRYANIPERHRVLSLPLVPWYRKRVRFWPENGTFSVE